MLRVYYIKNRAGAIEYYARDHQVPYLEMQYRFKERVYNTNHEQRIQVPELFNFPGPYDKVEVVYRFPVCVHIIGKDQLQRNLNNSPDQQRIQNDLKPVDNIFFVRFLNQRLSDKNA